MTPTTITRLDAEIGRTVAELSLLNQAVRARKLTAEEWHDAHRYVEGKLAGLMAARAVSQEGLANS